jgi:hypothetical protein
MGDGLASLPPTIASLLRLQALAGNQSVAGAVVAREPGDVWAGSGRVAAGEGSVHGHGAGPVGAGGHRAQTAPLAQRATLDPATTPAATAAAEQAGSVEAASEATDWTEAIGYAVGTGGTGAAAPPGDGTTAATPAATADHTPAEGPAHTPAGEPKLQDLAGQVAGTTEGAAGATADHTPAEGPAHTPAGDAKLQDLAGQVAGTTEGAAGEAVGAAASTGAAVAIGTAAGGAAGGGAPAGDPKLQDLAGQVAAKTEGAAGETADHALAATADHTPAGGAEHVAPGPGSAGAGPASVDHRVSGTGAPVEDVTPPSLPDAEDLHGPSVVDRSAEPAEVFPPTTSAADRDRATRFLEQANVRAAKAARAADGAGDTASRLIAAGRRAMSDELRTLDERAGPLVMNALSMASRAISMVQGRIETTRNDLQVKIKIIGDGVSMALRGVLGVVGTARQVLSLARRALDGALQRLRSIPLVGGLLSGALGWVRDKVGGMLAAAARIGGELLATARKWITDARTRIGGIVGEVVDSIVAALRAGIDAMLNVARMAAERALAAIRTAVTAAVARARARIASLTYRLHDRLLAARSNVRSEAAWIIDSASATAVRMAPTSAGILRAQAGALRARLLDRAERLGRVETQTKDALTTLDHEAVGRAEARAAEGEARVEVIRAQLDGTVTEATDAVQGVVTQISQAEASAFKQLDTALEQGEGILQDLAGQADHEAASGQAAASHTGG